MFLRSQLRRSGFKIITASLLLLLLLCHHYVEGQSNKVSSKLDFDDTEDKSNSSTSIVPGVGQDNRGGGSSGRSNDGGGGGTRGGSGNRGRDSDSDDDNTKERSGGKTGPKIHGVRVTVDTGDGKKSKESKESVEITDLGKHRKRVGIHTDITFEITADGADVLNSTTSAQRDDKEDASVPIFRGRGGHGHGSGSSHKPRKPYDSRTHWNPNFSAERRYGYDSSGRGGGGYYPQYPSYNVPVYTGSGDASRSAGGNIYRQGDGWNSYVPSTTYWTTERPYNEYYRPNSVAGHRTQNWKPCYCITAGADNRRRRESNQDGDGLSTILHAASPVIQVVDGKVEQPFSKK